MAWTERYVRADAAGGGDGTTNTNSGANGAFTLAEAITHSASNTGIRYNVVAAGGTFANTTTTRTFNGNGATTAPNWWRGCSATAGDLDADFSTAKPSWTFTTGRVVVSGTHQLFSNLNISGAFTTGGQVSVTANGCKFDRIRVENTNAAAASRAMAPTSSIILTRSWLKATSTATSVLNLATTGSVCGCAFVGGGHGIDCTGGGGIVIVGNSFNDVGGDGINVNTTAPSSLIIAQNTFYSPGGDGIEFAILPTAISYVVHSNIFDACAAYGINNSTGANTNFIHRSNNTFRASGTADENGFGDSASLTQIAESVSPFTGAAGGDLSLLSTAASKAAGLPGLFENQSYTSYLDVGSVQRQEAGSGGAGVPANLSGGIFQ